MSPATRALMCDEENVNISEKDTSARVRTSQEKEDTAQARMFTQNKKSRSCQASGTTLQENS